MRGVFYRMAVAIKEFGERRRSGALIRLGLFLRGIVSRMSAA